MSTDGARGSDHRIRTGNRQVCVGEGRQAAVIVVSTAAARGDAADRSGPLLVDWLRASGYECPSPLLAEDGGQVEEILRWVLDPPAPGTAPRLVVTSGGTGLNPADRTPQVTAALLDFQTPGIMHALWTVGLQSTPTAVMSQGVAGVRGSTFIVNLPGSTGGVRDGIAVLSPLLPHIQDQLEDCAAAPPR